MDSCGNATLGVERILILSVDAHVWFLLCDTASATTSGRKFYNIAVNALGLNKLSAEVRSKAVVEGDGKPLYEKIPSGLPLLPVVDDKVVLEAPDYSTFNLSGTFYPRLLIGDCRLDVSIPVV